MTESLDFDVAGIADQLAGVAGTEVKTDEMIAPYTSYKIGGPASIWAATSWAASTCHRTGPIASAA